MCGRSKRSGRLFERGTVFDQGQRIFRCGAQTSRFRVGEAIAVFRQPAEKLGGFGGTHTAKRFNSLDAHKLVAQRFVFAGCDFHQLRHGGGFLRQAELVNHHGHDHGMRVGEDRGEDESGGESRSGIVGTREFADGQILQVPFPAGHGAGEAAKQALGV